MEEHEDRSKEKKNARDNLIHAGEFTKTENTAGIDFLRGWIPEKNRQDDEIIKASDDVWALTILQEHFTSELNADVPGGGRTRESRAVLAELTARAEAAQARLAELIGEDDDEDEDKRMNDLTDATVKAVLDKFNL